MNYCPHCGHKLDGKYVLCPNCDRRLQYITRFNTPGGTTIVPCARCKGTGQVDIGGIFTRIVKTCPACGGAGVQRV
jgi:DnaJ-class molecular chaperone